MEGTFVIDTLEQFKALAHPLRLKIFEQMAMTARTTKEVAEELGEKPTRLYHHVAALDRAGLIRLVRTEPKRGATAKYYEAVARSVQVDPSLFAEEGSNAVLEQNAAGMVQGLVTGLSNDLTTLMNDPDAESGPLEEATLVRVEIYGSKEELQTARARLDAFLAELQSESAEPVPSGKDVEARRLVIAWYPPPDSK